MKPSLVELALFHASLARASSHPDFLDVFYDGFIDSSPQIAAVFENSDMNRLKRKLRDSLQMVTQLVDGEEGVAEYFGYIGRVHERLGIDISQYDHWLESLVNAACCCDREYDAVAASAWKSVVGYGIHCIRSAYSSAA